MSSTVVRLFQPPALSIACRLQTPAVCTMATPLSPPLSMRMAAGASTWPFDCRQSRSTLRHYAGRGLWWADTLRLEIACRIARTLVPSWRGGSALTCSAIEIEEAAAGKVHKLLALAVVIQADLLRLHSNRTHRLSLSAAALLITRNPLAPFREETFLICDAPRSLNWDPC